MKYLLFLLLLTGCYTEKKATEQVNKADEKFPQLVAKLARDKYPCTDLLKPDTTTIFKDTVIYVDCPDTASSNDFATVRVDTFNNVITTTKTIKVPVHLPVQVQYITKWYEDSAKLKLAALEQGKLVEQNTKLKSDNDSLSGKLHTRTKYLWWLLALCIGLLVWTFRKLFI